MYIILIPIQLIFVTICLSPLIIWHEVVYLPDEYYCYTLYLNLRALSWLLLNDYVLPLVCLLLIYFRIIIFLRKQSNNPTMIIRRQEQRDLIVIRRILVMASILLVAGTPSLVLTFKFHITHIEEPLFLRIAWFSFDLSITVLSLTQIILTPQLRQIVLKSLRINQITPTVGTTTV